MERLNLPTYSFNIKFKEQRKYIFDFIRRKYVLLTPEEWVRQNFLKYLVEEKKYPASLIAVEKEFKLNTLSKRSDAVVYNQSGNPFLMIECKATSVPIDQNVFDQIARYNMKLNVEYLVVTNGLAHYCCKIDIKNQKYYFLKDIPEFMS
ncbi:MAG TPA: type I restriction enzyme HsdR N-terminal domain-containing protein [Bacteroidales bacterium]|nr:type I restriction enzyme HsdR N-terminal domain-containing protein [Bacteroidales bacterium]